MTCILHFRPRSSDVQFVFYDTHQGGVFHTFDHMGGSDVRLCLNLARSAIVNMADFIMLATHEPGDKKNISDDAFNYVSSFAGPM